MKTLILSLVLLLSISSKAQGPIDYQLYDSLKHELAKEKNDSNRIFIMFSISETFSNPDSTLYWINQARELAEKTKNTDGEMAYYIYASDIYRNMGNYIKALQILYQLVNKGNILLNKGLYILIFQK